jgi:hypothetical protein
MDIYLFAVLYVAMCQEGVLFTLASVMASNLTWVLYGHNYLITFNLSILSTCNFSETLSFLKLRNDRDNVDFLNVINNLL